ncbi:MAG: oxidoreductase [Chloroflexia bacterium]|nr:oxidoreductase [Chloroflexia bacterium]
MERISLNTNFSLPRIVQGMWRLMEWKWNTKEIENFIKSAIEIGINAFDHADIYGNYECEKHFGKVLAEKPSLRSDIQLITKCGIKMLSDKFPERKIGHYDTSYQHVIKSVEQSLRNLNTDYIDLLLIHRPDPFMNPDETAKAFEELFQQGKVLNFGVSNFLPSQFEMLQSRLSMRLVTNQIEVAPSHLEHIYNGNLDFLQKERIHPMAWSPLGGGMIFNPSDENTVRLKGKLEQIAKELDLESVDKVIYSWILSHPAAIIPVVGSGKLNRLKSAVDALKVKLSTEQWFEILIASQGHPVP